MIVIYSCIETAVWRYLAFALSSSKTGIYTAIHVLLNHVFFYAWIGHTNGCATKMTKLKSNICLVSIIFLNRVFSLACYFGVHLTKINKLSNGLEVSSLVPYYVAALQLPQDLK